MSANKEIQRFSQFRTFIVSTLQEQIELIAGKHTRESPGRMLRNVMLSTKGKEQIEEK